MRFRSRLPNSKVAKPAPSQVKVEAPLPVFVPDPNSKEPPPPLMPSAPQGADTIRFGLRSQPPWPPAARRRRRTPLLHGRRYACVSCTRRSGPSCADSGGRPGSGCHNTICAGARAGSCRATCSGSGPRTGIEAHSAARCTRPGPSPRCRSRGSVPSSTHQSD